jgi:hypothetical protein
MVLADPKEVQRPVERSPSYGVAAAALVLGLAGGALLMYTSSVAGVEEVELSIVVIFLLSLLIGVAGAMVFLIVQMLTERDAGVLDRIMKSSYGIPPSVMTAMFVLSGGLVAGFSQASVGSFTAGNIWTVFLVGFGWQGAISGIGGAAAVRDTVTEGDVTIENLKGRTEEVVQGLVSQYKVKVQELEHQLRMAASAVPVPDAMGEALGEVLEEEGP